MLLRKWLKYQLRQKQNKEQFKKAFLFNVKYCINQLMPLFQK